MKLIFLLSVSVSRSSDLENRNISCLCTCSDFSVRIAPGVVSFFSPSISTVQVILVYTLSVGFFFFGVWPVDPIESHIHCIILILFFLHVALLETVDLIARSRFKYGPATCDFLHFLGTSSSVLLPSQSQ